LIDEALGRGRYGNIAGGIRAAARLASTGKMSSFLYMPIYPVAIHLLGLSENYLAPDPAVGLDGASRLSGLAGDLGDRSAARVAAAACDMLSINHLANRQPVLLDRGGKAANSEGLTEGRFDDL
jgi:hypothetical protein